MPSGIRIIMFVLFACLLALPSNATEVISHKTGARANVAAQYAARFQAYIDDLEERGSRILFMGGYRRGRCWSGGLHPCGKALDVCQLSRGRVDRRCHLPARNELARVAEAHGLFEGGQWCHSDYGHAQVGVTAGACGTQLAARTKHKHIQVASQQNYPQPNIDRLVAYH